MKKKPARKGKPQQPKPETSTKTAEDRKMEALAREVEKHDPEFVKYLRQKGLLRS